MSRAALAAALGAALATPAAAQSAMAPRAEYLMERDAEIALARSAAPEAIARDATVLVLGARGYETAVQGTNGFLCVVERGWNGPFDWPERWNPRIRAAGCLNPQAARSVWPVSALRTALVLAGRTDEEILHELRAAYARRDLPPLEPGAMAYMMSPAAYLTDLGEHNLVHVMFYTTLTRAEEWGANLPGSPFLASPFWFGDPPDESVLQGLPGILVFLIGVPEAAPSP